ncbi:MAG: CoB--CoM heterodisulfide reductase iron-sulfur subunit B family protein [Candidatus Heimdallarchaeota archaeon]
MKNNILLDKNFKFTMFWGCTIPYRLPFIESAVRKVFHKLKIDHEDLGFSCCPDPNGIQAFDFFSWITLGVRNLTLAEEKGNHIVSACNGCFETLKVAHYHMSKDKILKKQVNKVLKETTGREWTGKSKVMHLLDFVYEYVNIEELQKQIVRPLTDFKFSTHLGCHYTKPTDIMQTDDPNNPVKLKSIIEDLLGARFIPYMSQNDCCGAGLRSADKELALEMMNRKFEDIDKAQPDGVVVICPTCFNSFDSQQRLINKKFNRKETVPTYYFFELLALAIGIPEKELGFKFHSIKNKDVFSVLEENTPIITN